MVKNACNKSRNWLLLTTAAGLALMGLIAVALPADAHGAATRPGSRTYLCRIDGTHASGDINPSNPACAAAVDVGGKQPLWDWFGVLRADGAGRTRGYIPDGQLCSGGEPKYAGYDLARSDWPHTRLTGGAAFTIRYNAWAAHPGEFRLYITKDGFDPTKPLAWDDLEDEPFSVWNQNAPNGQDGQNNTPDYQWDVTMPNKTGQHIIYSVWSRSDSEETFYGCSDVRFDGGSGQVVGVGAGATPVGAPSGGAAPVAPAPVDQTSTPSTVAPPSPPADESDPAPTQRSQEAMTDDAPTDGQVNSVAGSEAATDGVTSPPAEQTVLVPANGLADPEQTASEQAGSDGVVLEGITSAGLDVDGNQSNGVAAAPIVQQSSGGLGLITIVAVAVAGLTTGVAISVVAFSSPRARGLFEARP